MPGHLCASSYEMVHLSAAAPPAQAKNRKIADRQGL